jgi:bifunctional non-homologous end joining protein LigD
MSPAKKAAASAGLKSDASKKTASAGLKSGPSKKAASAGLKSGPAKKTASAGPKSGRSTKTAAAKLVLHGITITHPERVIEVTTGLTKGKLAEYYALVAPYLLRGIANHPVTLIRCPEGIGGETFYQRNPGRGLGPDVCPFTWHYKNKVYEYLYVRSAMGLMELIQMNTVEFHPWGTHYKRMDYPDRAIFDLDPDPTVPFEAVKLAAQDLRVRLEKLGLESFLRCTGGKGLHVIVPLAEEDHWDDVKEWSRSVAEQMVRDVPDAYVATMTKAKRTGKIFVDFFRNDYTATAVGDFSVRARPGAPVAVPLEWSELKKLTAPDQFSVDSVIRRVKRKPPDDARYKLKQRIPKRTTGGT